MKKTFVCSLLALTLGCSARSAEPGTRLHGDALGTGPAVGLVTGGIYEAGPQSLATHAEAFFCEMDALGVEWIRVEADWYGVSDQTYRDIVRRAHAHGIGVVVVVAASTCPAEGRYLGVGPFDDGDTASIDRFTEAYLAYLDQIAERFGPELPDAFEITNEPDLFFDHTYPAPYHAHGCLGFNRVGGNTSAWLLRRVAPWARARGVSIVSGGTLAVPDAPLDDRFWGAFLRSGAWSAGDVPFDYLGLHPYRPFAYSNDCVERGELSCFRPWADAVRRGVSAVRDAVATATGRTPRVMVTEWGWQTLDPEREACAPASMCVRSERQRVEAMRLGAAAMSGLVDVAFWYAYRDDRVGAATNGFGIRGLHDEGRGLHSVKLEAWRELAQLGGGPGGDPDACWTSAPPSDEHHVLRFDEGDARRSEAQGDWRWSRYKAQCGIGEMVTGLSATPESGVAHAALCQPRPEGSAQRACAVRVFSEGDDRGTTETGDWDWLHYKGECAIGEHVAGVAQTTAGALDAILCCEGAVLHQDCRPRRLDTGDDRGEEGLGDWAPGRFKLECGPGRYIAGVSRTPDDGRPRSVLCCRP